MRFRRVRRVGLLLGLLPFPSREEGGEVTEGAGVLTLRGRGTERSVAKRIDTHGEQRRLQMVSMGQRLERCGL